MDASIRDPHLKDFVRFLQCASKYGDELHMHAHGDVWEMSAMNTNKSAYALFKLYKTFFTRWSPLRSTVRQRKGMKCKLAVKSLLGVLGKTSSLGNVDRLDMKFVDPDASLLARMTSQHPQDEDGEELEYAPRDEAQSRTAMLVVKLVCKHGVIKKHSLNLDSSEFLRAEVNPDTTPSGLTADARQLRDILDHFNLTLGPGGPGSGRTETQLGWMFTPSAIRIKSWTYVNREMQTEVVLDPAEFMSYEVAEAPIQAMQGSQDSRERRSPRVELSMPMKEFHATLSLAEQLHEELDINFSEAGQPLVLMTANEDDDSSFQIFCAIATSSCDVFDDVATTPARSVAKDSRSTPLARAGSRDTTDRRGLDGVDDTGYANGGAEDGDENGLGHAEPSVSDSSSGRRRPPKTQNGSDRPSKRPKPTLELSSHPNGHQTVTIVGAPLNGEASGVHGSQASGRHRDEPLFLSNSQATDGDGAGPGNSQSVTRMTNDEVLQQYLGISSQREAAEFQDGLDEAEEADEQEQEKLAAEEEQRERDRTAADAEALREAEEENGRGNGELGSGPTEPEEPVEPWEELPATQSQGTFPEFVRSQPSP